MYGAGEVFGSILKAKPALVEIAHNLPLCCGAKPLDSNSRVEKYLGLRIYQKCSSPWLPQALASRLGK